MKKLLFILTPLIFCTPLLSCSQGENANTENFNDILVNNEALEDRSTEVVSGIESERILDSLTGYYARYIKLQDNERIYIDFFIYEEEKQYYGYLNIIKYDRDNNCFHGRVLTEVCQKEDAVQIIFAEEFSEPEASGYFGTYQKGDLLFTIEKGEDEVYVSWEKFPVGGLDDIEFFRMDSCLSVQLVNQRDIEVFLKARGMEDKLFFRYEEDEADACDYLEVYYDEPNESGAGVYCIQYSDGDTYYSGFDITDCIHRSWEDNRFDIIKDEQNLLEEYDFDEEYNEHGQIVKLETKGEITGWSDGPYEDTIVCVEYFYREDGTLERKECYFNDRVFGTTRCSETYYFDEQERLKYVSAYITHGTLQDYYIYEGDSLEPAYCLGVDFMGTSASEYCFIKYDGESTRVPMLLVVSVSVLLVLKYTTTLVFAADVVKLTQLAGAVFSLDMLPPGIAMVVLSPVNVPLSYAVKSVEPKISVLLLFTAEIFSFNGFCFSNTQSFCV